MDCEKIIQLFISSQNQNNWINTLSALLVPTIAIVVAIIACMQYHVNYERHRFELFNKRFSIYRKLRSFLLNIVQPDNFITEKTLKKIYRVFDESEFLFGDDITQYINEIRNNTFSLNQKSLKLENTNLNKKDIAQLEHDIDALKLDFDKQLIILQTKFSKYLKFEIVMMSALHRLFNKITKKKST